MKLYKLKDSVTEEMLRSVHLVGEVLSGSKTFILDHSDCSNYAGIKVVSAWAQETNSCFYLPPEWLEEVESPIELTEQDASSFGIWLKENKDKLQALPRDQFAFEAYHAALEYERGRK